MEKYLTEFKAEAKELVGYLKKEFDINKSAEELKRAVINKTGKIDERRLYAYKLKDDIFKRNIIIKQAQNHGMVFLLDWSSSMTSVMQKTIEQLYVLVSFCRACHIPFRVYAFSARNLLGTTISAKRELDISTLEFKLIEFYNDKMDFNEFRIMSDRLLSTFIFRPRTQTVDSIPYALHNTPYNHALAYMVFNLPKFKKTYGLEKLTLVCLTDGQSSSLCISQYDRRKVRFSYIAPNKKRYELVDADNLCRKTSRVNNEVMETSALVRMIQDTTGATVVGLNVTHSDFLGVRDALIIGSCSTRISDDDIKSCRKSDCYVLNKTHYDLSLVFPRLLKSSDDVEISSDIGEKTSKNIAKEFIKLNKVRKQKRMFLDAFIKTVA